MSQVELTTLGKSCEFFNGKAHEKSIDENGKYIVVNSKFISSEGKSFKRTNEQMFPLYKGDIVMVMSDVPNGKALAKCFIIDKDDTYSLNQRICCIRSKEFDTKYLYYQLNRHEHFLTFNNGENQTNLRKDDILACPLLRVKYSKQVEIAHKLDIAFGRLDKAYSIVEKNIINSKDIFISKATEIFSQFKSEYNVATLEKLCNFYNGLWTGKNPPFRKAKVIRNTNFTKDCKLDLSDVVELDVEIKQLEKRKLEFGDIILEKSGGGPKQPVGRVVLFERNDADFSFSNFTSAIRIKDKNQLNYRYLQNFLFYEYFSGSTEPMQSHSTGIRNLKFDEYKAIEVPLAEISKQLEVAEKLDKLFEEVNKLMSIYSERLLKINELKSELLKRAFHNELIEAE